MGSFSVYLTHVRDQVETYLDRSLSMQVASARSTGGALATVIDSLRALTMRGGKRLRAALLCAGYEACGGQGGAAAVIQAAAAIELLQSYLLIHDDWMDADDVRRGGPSVHAFLREKFGSVMVGDSSAILAGDFASALAQETLLTLPFSADRVLDAAREFAAIQQNVALGQLLDVHSAEGDDKLIERMHELKTGSYTVRGPLRIGALLAGAPHDQLEGLTAFARPLGIAFQLRDDLLGMFGDPRATGKSVGSDLRQGKRTPLVAQLESDAEARPILKRVFGRDDAAADDVQALVNRVVASGTKSRVESRLTSLLEQARQLLRAIPLEPTGLQVLQDAVDALGERER